MAEQDTLELATSYLDNGVSFLVEAGAGSGKTSTLIRSLRHLLDTRRDDLEQASKQIVCITYTNVAKDEIIDRIAADPLVLVSTIHEFLWSIIERFQVELKKELVAWNSSENKKPVPDLEESLRTRKVFYSDRGRRLEEGQISHDDVITLASRLFRQYPKIVRIARSRYPYLLVDEYQDTHKPVVDLILDAYASAKDATVGFFGDSMQKIYQTGVGRLKSDKLQVITKTENYRCSRAVIGVLNAMRPELQQILAGDDVEGEVYFFAGPDEIPLSAVRRRLEDRGWPADDTKVLMLTHRGIAGQLSYHDLLAAYDKRGSFGRDRLFEGDDVFVKVLGTVRGLVSAYGKADLAGVAEILRGEGFQFRKHSDKADQLGRVKKLTDAAARGTVGSVLDIAFETRVVAKPESMRRIEERVIGDDLSEIDLKYKKFLEALRVVPFVQVVNFFEYLDGSAPFFTQHGVKGAEYENVIVAIDDSTWNLYSMGKMLSGIDSSQTRIERSRNLFYVSCSRAKSGLAVVFLKPPPAAAIQTARKWFGAANVYESA